MHNKAGNFRVDTTGDEDKHGDSDSMASLKIEASPYVIYGTKSM
jgi:hypothetical protein